MTSLEIICVGNELLIGKILNTNARWLARRATIMGITVKRIIVVGDDLEEVASAIRESLARKPRFIITTGGLGPTFDDKTLEGIAKALGRELILNDKALQMIKTKYRAYVKSGETEMTPHRTKMAMLPEGSEPLPNPVGTAPGVMLDAGNTIIFALPGVPAEMESIFEGSISAVLKRESGGMTFYETSMYVEDMMESTLAPLIDATMQDNPYIYIKSHPSGSEDNPRIEIHFSTVAKDSSLAKGRIGKAMIQLSELINKRGGRVKVQAPPRKAYSPKCS
ncbi:MAG: nicotinamide mononucleotide deamidase-related protein [Nitrososphaerota archaeon]|nr:nicotinamide mononucleotide deamidase-related protein [Candidatus Bathyarchaeota archaeon]MDW8193834.1 nicotinamide mononucleotide deamidase-related protein [Nitrososphaerota archaeon]